MTESVYIWLHNFHNVVDAILLVLYMYLIAFAFSLLCLVVLMTENV